MVSANVPVEGWIICPDKHGLHDGLCNAVRLPTHNGEAVHPGMMICCVGMVIDGGMSPEMFLSLLPEVLADPAMFFSLQS